MLIATSSYEEVHNQYSAALKWMDGLGIKLAPGRTAFYEKVIAHWKDVYKTASDQEGERIFPDFVSSMFEVFDFLSIHRAFHDVAPADLPGFFGPPIT